MDEAPAIVVVDRPGLLHGPVMGGNRPCGRPHMGGQEDDAEPSLDTRNCYSRVSRRRTSGVSGSDGRVRRITLLPLHLDKLLLPFRDEQEPTDRERAESREAQPRRQRRCDPHPHGSQCARIRREHQTSEITTWLQKQYSRTPHNVTPVAHNAFTVARRQASARPSRHLPSWFARLGVIGHNRGRSAFRYNSATSHRIVAASAIFS